MNIIEDDISFKNLILDCVSIHNNKVHTVTGLKPSFLIKNTDEEIYNIVADNIKKCYKNILDEDKDNYILNMWDHLLTLWGPYKPCKNIKCRKTNFKTSKIPLTVINNFYFEIIKVKIDADISSFKIGILILSIPNMLNYY